MLSVLGCDKHSPRYGPLWGADRTKFLALYKALVGAPDGAGGKEKWDSRARVLRAPTSMKRVRRVGLLRTIERGILSCHSEPYV